MKNKWWILLKVQLLGQFRLKEKKTGHKILLIAYGIIGIILAFYSFILAMGLCMIKMSELIPSYAIAVTGLVTLIFTAIKTNGVIFGNKDYDILMSLPVKTSTVIASRFLSMYVLNLALTALVMIPMGIAFFIFAKPGFLFYPFWFLGMVFAPFIPSTLATLFGALIILFSSRFKYANAATTVLSLGITVGIIVASFGIGNVSVQLNREDLSSIGNLLLEKIQNLYPPAILFHKAVVQNDIGSFFVLLFISGGWYYLFIKLMSLGYKKMNTGLMTYYSKANFKMNHLKSTTPLLSIYKKELKRFFSSTIYLLNMGMGLIMAVLLAGACVFVGVEKMTSGAFQEFNGIFSSMLPFLIIICLSMTITTSVSLSLEGRNLWIIKSMPLTDLTIFQGKMLLNLSLQIPASVLCSILLWIALKPDLVRGFFFLVMPIVFCCFITVFGMVMNVSMPNYQWISETTIIKQSAPFVISLFVGMINGALPMVFLIIPGKVNITLVMGIFTIIEGIFTWLLYSKLKKMKI